MLTLQCAIPPVVFVVTLVPFYLQQLELVRHPLVEAVNSMVKARTLSDPWSVHYSYTLVEKLPDISRILFQLACLSTLLSPLIVLFLIRPYRRCFARSMGVFGVTRVHYFQSNEAVDRGTGEATVAITKHQPREHALR